MSESVAMMMAESRAEANPYNYWTHAHPCAVLVAAKSRKDADER
jgi:hypothetical protein